MATDHETRTREQLRAFFAAQGQPDDLQIVDLVRPSHGRSRDQWLFDIVTNDGAQTIRQPLILRRDPLGGLVKTERAHEFALLRALEDSTLPTPRARWLDTEGIWFGQPSLIMDRANGRPEYFILNGDLPLTERVWIAEQLCDLLASVHTVDWRRLGLSDTLTDPGPWASRTELANFVNVLHTDQLEPYPELELAIDWLSRNAPQSRATVLVHADFKAGNVLFEDNQIGVLLDWELAHLGDPMEDLGWVTQPLREREHLIRGSWERQHLIDRYTDNTGFNVDPASLHWWNTFSTFKIAVWQVSGLRSYLEGRSDESYRPTAKVLTALLRALEG